MNVPCLGRWIGLAVCACYSASLGVTFQFEAPISMVYGQQVGLISNAVTVGMMCSGTLSYDPQNAFADSDPSTNNGYYGFGANQMKVHISVGTNVVVSTDTSQGDVQVTYQQNTPLSDGISYMVVGALWNGQPFPGPTDSQYVTVEMVTTNLSVLASDSLPTQTPDLAYYPSPSGRDGFRQLVVYTYSGGQFAYGFSGTLVSITPIPLLSAQAVGTQFLVSWPTNSAGFQLQKSLTPDVPGSWRSVTASPTNQNGSFQVGVPLDNLSWFFRLAATTTPQMR